MACFSLGDARDIQGADSPAAQDGDYYQMINDLIYPCNRFPVSRRHIKRIIWTVNLTGRFEPDLDLGR
jgi:hypothetical protein